VDRSGLVKHAFAPGTAFQLRPARSIRREIAAAGSWFEQKSHAASFLRPETGL
jgi:hypothetical protein